LIKNPKNVKIAIANLMNVPATRLISKFKIAIINTFYKNLPIPSAGILFHIALGNI
jgi:hypothetical protein